MLGNQVLTDSGVDLGEVVDVIVEFERADGTGSGPCDVVGYEIKASESLATSKSKGGKSTKLLVPLPDTLVGLG